VALEFFKMQHVSTPMTSKYARKRLSEQLGELNVQQEPEDTALFSHSDPRFSVVQDVSPMRQKELGLNDREGALLKDAMRIFRTFFEDGAPHWCCIDDHLIAQMRTQLKEAHALDFGFFSEAQHQIFLTMQADTFPKFIKAVLADPDKFSSGARLEIDQATRDHLDKIFEGGQDVAVSSPRVRSMKMEGADRTLSPKFSARSLATVSENDNA
jgi:hypothetical protein